MIEGRNEAHSEGSYYPEWWDGGKRYREGAGRNAFAAAEKVRVKQAELTAVRSGIIRPPAKMHHVDPHGDAFFAFWKARCVNSCPGRGDFQSRQAGESNLTISPAPTVSFG